jgi:hypothetical protein
LGEGLTKKPANAGFFVIGEGLQILHKVVFTEQRKPLDNQTNHFLLHIQVGTKSD